MAEPTARPVFGSRDHASRVCRVVPWPGRRAAPPRELSGRAGLLAGAWLFVSPWWIVTTEAAAWSAWGTGAAMLSISAIALICGGRRIASLNVLPALWLFASPWIVPSLPGMSWNAWILGALVCASVCLGVARALRRRRRRGAPAIPIRFRRPARRPWPSTGVKS